MMDISDIKCMLLLFTADMRGGDTCISRFEGMFFVRADPFICDELHLNEIEAAGFCRRIAYND